MCINHGSRHIPAELVALMAEHVNRRDRGSTENADWLLRTNLALLCWVGWLNYITDLRDSMPEDLYQKGEAAYLKAVKALRDEGNAYTAAHPEVGARPRQFRGMTLSVEEEVDE